MITPGASHTGRADCSKYNSRSTTTAWDHKEDIVMRLMSWVIVVAFVIAGCSPAGSAHSGAGRPGGSLGTDAAGSGGGSNMGAQGGAGGPGAPGGSGGSSR